MTYVHTYSTVLAMGLMYFSAINARNEWNTIKNTVSPNSQTVASFNENISAFKKIYVPDPSAIDVQRNYLIFYHSMQLRWRTNFVNSSQNVQQVSTKVLCTYMVQQEAQIDTHRKRVCESNKKQQQKTPFN